MNLQCPAGNDATDTRNRSRNVAPYSGLCTRCLDSCAGNCEVFRSSLRGREVIYPGPFGELTAGGDKDYPVDYSHINILGYALGAESIDEASPDKAIFPEVDTATVYGHTHPVRMKMPIFTGALGSTEIARKHWEGFAVGTALSGISVVIGENVCGIDPDLKRNKDGQVTKSPEMERRISLYKKWQGDHGDVLVQLNVEDTRLGVAEYVVGDLVVVVPQRRDLVDALGVTGKQDGVGHVAGADLDVVLDLVVGVLAVAGHGPALSGGG